MDRSRDDADVPATTLHVRRALGGDEGSTSWLVARLAPLLIAQAEYRLGSLRQHHDATDLVNDAWLVVLPRLGELRARDGRFTPVLLRFLTTTLLYRIHNLWQKHGRQVRFELPAGADSVSGSDGLGQIPDGAAGVVTAAIAGEAAGKVRACLDRLGEADREIILLRGIEQRSNRSVAEHLGLTPVAAAVRYHRALRRLRRTLPDSVFDELPG